MFYFLKLNKYISFYICSRFNFIFWYRIYFPINLIRSRTYRAIFLLTFVHEVTIH